MAWRCPCGGGTLNYDMGELPDHPYARRFEGGRGWEWTCASCESWYGVTVQRHEVRDAPEAVQARRPFGSIYDGEAYFFERAELARINDAWHERLRADGQCGRMKARVVQRAIADLDAIAAPARYAAVATMLKFQTADAAKQYIARRRPKAVMESAAEDEARFTALLQHYAEEAVW